MAEQQPGNLKATYQFLTKERNQYLQRARHNALLTLPALMPVDGRQHDAHLIEPYQSLGADGVVHLSSRMTIALLPAGRPFLRLDLPPSVLAQMDSDVPTEVTIGLSKAEQMITAEVEDKGWRKATMMTMQHLIVAGNMIEYIQPDNTIRTYRLDQFVQRFDSLGNLVEIIIMEKFPRAAVPTSLELPPSLQSSTDSEEELEMYTQIMRQKAPDGSIGYTRKIEWSNGSPVGEVTHYDEEHMPYITLGWAPQPGENYARSKVEEKIADLRSLDALEKAQLEMAAMASRNFIMIRPGAQSASLRRRIVESLNGDALVGDPETVDLKSFDNQPGYQLVQVHVQQLRESLSRAFMLLSAGQRDAERVTAVEIERDIAELEAALGGVFSALAQDMMKRRTLILIGNMVKQGKLPPFPPGMVQPTILTGLEALSRERDVSRAMQAGQIVAAFGPEAVDAIKLDRVLGRAFVGLGIPDAVRTEEEIAGIRQQRQEAANQQALQEKLGPPAINAAASVAKGGQ